MLDDLAYTPEEIEELANVARGTYTVRTAFKTEGGKLWRAVVLSILRRRHEQAVRRLARDLEDPESAASRLRDELRDLRCPHCGKRLEDGSEERDHRG